MIATQLRLTTALVGVAMLPGMALAQSTGNNEPSGLEEIVVTAQRRQESLQDVPIAVAAMSATSLARAGVNSSSDLSASVPGLQLSYNRNVVAPYLRGVGTATSVAGEEGSIATYIDGVYAASLSAAMFALNNIERIEVLKGPQGTLFGRNATGGLIHVITRTPSHDPELKVSLGYGNFDTVTGTLYGTTGITESVAADISVFYSSQGEGWGKNLNIGGDVNYRDEWAVRSKLLLQPTENLTITLAGNYNYRESDIGNVRHVLPGAVLIGGAKFKGTIYDSQGNFPRKAEAEQYGLSMKAELDLGDVTLTSTTAYGSSYNFGLFDQDGGPLRVIDALFTEDSTNFQQELLLNGSADRLNWTAGVFYFHANAKVDPLGLRSVVVPPQNRDRFSEIKTNSYAIFADGSYEILDNTRFTAGLRFTRDELSQVGADIAVSGNPLGPPGTILSSRTQEAAFKKLTWRLLLDHNFTPDILGYISYNRGFKSGVFNIVNFEQPSVRPETIDAYAIGVKSDLFDDIIRLNIEAFLYDYQDIQLQRTEAGLAQILNAAKARIKGVDVELVIAPPVDFGNLDFGATFSFLDGEYTDFPDGPITTRNPAGGNILTLGDLSGVDTIRTPPVTFNLAANYEVPVGSNKLGFHLSYYYNDGFFWEADNRVRQSSYDLLGAQITLAAEDNRWEFKLFGSNLTDTKYYAQVNQGSLGDAGSPGAPRTYGATISVKF